MSDKAKRLICIYACAAIAVLGLCAAVGNTRLRDFRLAARYSAARAFDETVGAVDSLSLSLRKSLYATDGGMCCRICSDVYADARSAEAAMSTLPFSTVELAQISGFLGVAGDYAYSLCSEAAAEGFSDEQIAALTDMAATAEEFSAALREMRGSINDGTITMDSREVRLANVGEDTQQHKLSERLNEVETSFAAPAALRYDGRYSAKDKPEAKTASGEELAQMAADFLAVNSAQLDLKYEYNEESCRRCYAGRGCEVCVCPDGVVSMGSSRLVSEANFSIDEARQTAEDFLKNHGYRDLQLSGSGQNGAVAVFEYAQLAGEAVCLDKTVTVSVALDDNSVYAFNAERYDPDIDADAWQESMDPGSVPLAAGLTLSDARAVVIESAGGNDLLCWELHCTDTEGRNVTIYTDAQTGAQREIVPEK